MALVNVDPAPLSVSAHTSAADARAGRNAVAPGTTDAPPTHYRVTFDFDTLSSAGARHRPTIVHIDLTANGDYPFKEPVCRVIGDATPWTPHFHPVHPICIGAGWSRDGRTLAVDLVTHIAKLLNFDEPRPTPGYEGWNAAAIRWWVEEHKCRPLDSNLRYPVIDPNAAPGTRGQRVAAATRHAPRVAAAGTRGAEGTGGPRVLPAAARPRVRPATRGRVVPAAARGRVVPARHNRAASEQAAAYPRVRAARRTS